MEISRSGVEIRHAGATKARTGSIFLLLLFLCVACAIPVMPTGGPQDDTPPQIVMSEPAAESVNITTDGVRIVFSEFVDQGSFAQALTVSPAFDRPLQYRWRKKRVDITFPEPLRENTTYILTIDTNLRDANRVALKQPITLAFATGPEINRGKIAGKVIEPLKGEGVPGFDVFAFARPDSTLPDSLPDRPAYRTQTDENGQFAFDYMSEQPYFVIGLRDRNRNRTPDALEPYAVPPQPTIMADSVLADSTRLWFVTQRDTIPPEIQRIRSISNQRFMLRLSESIELLSRDPAGWSLRDSVSNAPYPVEEIYLYPEDPRQVYIKTPSLFATTHMLQPAGMADSSGNPVVPDAIAFRPSAATDTLQLRFLGFFPEDLQQNENSAYVLPPGKQAGVRFNQPVDSTAMPAIVSLQDSSARAYAYDAVSNDGSVYFFTPRETMPADVPFTVLVDGNAVGVPDTTYTRRFQYLTTSGLGELSGFITASDTTGQIIVELFPSREPLPNRALATQRPDATGKFIFSNLPDKSQYQFRAFVDKNGNQLWDGGSLMPYLQAEPLTWHADSLQVRARWEQSLADTLRLR